MARSKTTKFKGLTRNQLMYFLSDGPPRFPQNSKPPTPPPQSYNHPVSQKLLKKVNKDTVLDYKILHRACILNSISEFYIHVIGSRVLFPYPFIWV